jgi:hypothetical protein
MKRKKEVMLELDHGGPNQTERFKAKLYQGGEEIDLIFGDKRVVTIQHDGGETPIELMCPSVDGKVLRCFLEDGSEKFFETATGLPMAFTAKGRATDNPEYRPTFYA